MYSKCFTIRIWVHHSRSPASCNTYSGYRMQFAIADNASGRSSSYIYIHNWATACKLILPERVTVPTTWDHISQVIETLIDLYRPCVYISTPRNFRVSRVPLTHECKPSIGKETEEERRRNELNNRHWIPYLWNILIT